jgi:soluble lytic murein transglycosylase-like protein
VVGNRLCLFFLVLSISISSLILTNFKDSRENLFQIDGVELDSLSDYPTSIQMYYLIDKYSDEYNIPKWIAFNISYKETRYMGPFHWEYKPSQISSMGALGPMQIMPGTSKIVNGESVTRQKLKTDLEYNISTSMKLLRILHDKWGDWEIVCGCYNTGKPIINEYARYCANNKDYRKNWVKWEGE